MQPNFQQYFEDEDVPDSHPERTMFPPSSLYIQQSAPQVLRSHGADGYDELHDVAASGQLYNVPVAAASPDGYEPQYEPGALSTLDPFRAEAQSLEDSYNYWQEYSVNSTLCDIHAIQGPPAYAQQPLGNPSHGSAVLDVPPAQEGSVSSLGRKRSRRKERIVCSHIGCGREMTRDSLGRHVKEIHYGMKRRKPRRDEQDPR